MANTDLALIYENLADNDQAVYLDARTGEYYVFSAVPALVNPSAFGNPFLPSQEGVWEWRVDGSVTFTSFRTQAVQILTTIPRVPDGFGGGSVWDRMVVLPDGSAIVHPSGGLTVHRVQSNGNVQTMTLPTPAFDMGEVSGGGRGRVESVGFRPSDGAVSILFGNNLGSTAAWVFTGLFVPSSGATPGIYTPSGLLANGFLSFSAWPACASMDDRVGDGYVLVSNQNAPAYPLGGGQCLVTQAGAASGGAYLAESTYTFTKPPATEPGYTLAQYEAFDSVDVEIPGDINEVLPTIITPFNTESRGFFGPYSPPAPIPTPPFWTQFVQCVEVIDDVPPDPSFLPDVGDYWPGQGGYYAGIMTYPDSSQYHIIVAPIENDVMADNWTASTGEVPGARSNVNGIDNTQALLALPYQAFAAEYCAGLAIDGHTDFYLMAGGTYDYDADGGYLASEAYFLSQALGYGAGVALFESGGAQAFHPDDFYWSSTEYASFAGEYSGFYATRTRLNDGAPNDAFMTSDFVRVRPIRRFPV